MRNPRVRWVLIEHIDNEETNLDLIGKYQCIFDRNFLANIFGEYSFQKNPLWYGIVIAMYSDRW